MAGPITWTAKLSRNWLSLVPGGASAGDATDDWQNSVDGYWPEMKVCSVLFEPTAANERLIVRDGATTGPEICDLSGADANDQQIKYVTSGGKWADPYVDFSECTFSITTTASKIMFEFK